MGNSLAVQWLGLGVFTTVGLGSIPGRGTKTLQAAQCDQKKRVRESCSWKQQQEKSWQLYILLIAIFHPVIHSINICYVYTIAKLCAKYCVLSEVCVLSHV